MNPPSKTTSGPSFGLRLMLRLAGWSLSAAVALVVLLYIAMPAMLRFGIPHALSRYGIASSIESARVDFAEEKITLTGFNVGPDDGPGIRWGEVVARVDMPALLKGNIRILDFQVKDARVDLQQLATVKWDPSTPDDEGRSTSLPLDLGEAAIQDLKFIGLSEKLGRPVSIKSLRLGNLGQLSSGSQVAFQLDAGLGEAPLKLSGKAMLEGDLPVLEGRYELGAFSLAGVSAALDMAKTGSIGGRASGAGTFSLRYLTEGALVKLGVSGRLAVADLTLDSPRLKLTEGGFEWDGSVDLNWSVGSNEHLINLDGVAASKRIAAAYTKDDTPLVFESDELRWNGKVRFEKTWSMSGRVEGNVVQFQPSKSDDAWRVELRAAALDALAFSEGEPFAVGAITANEAKVLLNRDEGKRHIDLTGVSISKLEAIGNGFVIRSAGADSAQSAVRNRSTGPQWSVAGITAEDIDISNDGDLSVAVLKTLRSQLEVDATHISTTETEVESLVGSVGGRWAMDELKVASLVHKNAEHEVWGNGLELSGGQYAITGKLTANSVSAGSVSKSSANRLEWEIAAVRALAVSIASAAYRADEVEAGSFVHRLGANDAIEIDGAKAMGVAVENGSDALAAQLRFEKLRYQQGEIQSIELTGATTNAPSYGKDGRFAADRVDAKQLRFNDAAANATWFDGIAVNGVAGNVSSGVQVATARVEGVRHDSAAGIDVNGQTLVLDNVQAAFAGAIGAKRAKLSMLKAGLADGVELTVSALELARPSLKPADAALAAESISAGKLGLHKDSNRRLSVYTVEGGKLEPAPGTHALTNVRATRVEATDEVIGTRLDAGRLSVDQLTVAKSGRVGIERGSVSSFALADTRGSPAAAFSAENILVRDAVIEPGKLLNLGQVELKDIDAVIGFSEFSRFVLPKAPFSGNGEESDLAVAISRMTTSGGGKLSFFDRSTTPPFELALTQFNANIENYHSKHFSKQAKFAAEGRVDEFSTLKVDGTVAHSSDGMDLNLNGKVTAFELKRLNTYAEKHAQRTIRAGRGDASFDIRIQGKKLTGNSQLVFSKVKFERGAQSTISGQAQDLSLDGAFAMLKDKDDVVKVSVPLSGSLDDPQFDFSDAVAQAIVKTVQNTVLLTFKPLGLLASVAGAVGVGGGLRFNPVAFNAGDGNLNGQGLTYLDSLARELQKRPNVDVKVCGRAVPADLTALEQASASGAALAEADANLRQRILAETRATVVRQYLVQKKSIDPARLLDCASEVESTAGSLPRTEMVVSIEGEVQPVTVEPKAKGTAN